MFAVAVDRCLCEVCFEAPAVVSFWSCGVKLCADCDPKHAGPAAHGWPWYVKWRKETLERRLRGLA